VHTEFRHFLRDLIWLLGGPAALVVALLFWWHPWRPSFPGSEEYYARRDLETQARRQAIRQATWRGLHLVVPTDLILLERESILEVLVAEPARDTVTGWPGQMALLAMDSRSAAAFASHADNCSLVEGRCWDADLDGHRMSCQRSGGVPDPDVPWTPHLECHVPDLGIRVLINAPMGESERLLGLFTDAVRTRPTQT
jgi:hypothetical protein